MRLPNDAIAFWGTVFAIAVVWIGTGRGGWGVAGGCGVRGKFVQRDDIFAGGDRRCRWSEERECGVGECGVWDGAECVGGLGGVVFPEAVGILVFEERFVFSVCRVRLANIAG